MKKFIETSRNIYNIEELRKRIGYTIMLVLVYRLGSFILLPGLDPEVLKGGISGTQEGLVGLLNMFSGGAFGNASIFALGVMPYISASIIVQLLGMFVPSFRKMQMEGESGRRKMNQITRYLTVVILAIQGPAYVAGMIPAAARTTTWSPFMFNVVSTIILMAGSMFVMWLGERITDRGIGNGISLIIMIGIVARLPYALVASKRENSRGKSIKAWAKMIGITPAALIFRGMYWRTPPYCLLPMTLLAYCTGTFLTACTRAIVATITRNQMMSSTMRAIGPPPAVVESFVPTSATRA